MKSKIKFKNNKRVCNYITAWLLWFTPTRRIKHTLKYHLKISHKMILDVLPSLLCNCLWSLSLSNEKSYNNRQKCQRVSRKFHNDAFLATNYTLQILIVDELWRNKEEKWKEIMFKAEYRWIMGYKFYIMSLLENKTKDLKTFYDFQKKSIKETHKNLSKELYNLWTNNQK